MHIARVIVNLSLDRAFDYIIPDDLCSSVHAGVQVNVPFGKSYRNGYVIALTDHSRYPLEELRRIESVCERHPRIPSVLLELGKWMADYYCCSKEQCIRSLLPGSVRRGKIKHKTLSLYSIKDTAETEKFLIEHGKRSKAKAQVLQTLLSHKELSIDQLTQEADAGRTVVAALVKAGLVTEEKVHVNRDPYEDALLLPSQPRVPTEEQAFVLNQIFEMMAHREGPRTVLLHGVTGSGKTEVYLQAIAKALETGRESIVLVPEISLTPQTVSRFRSRFGENVCVMHSMLTEGERYDAWMKVYDGKVKIVVGARSALFAPFRNLGLVIVDEEHENSYKQSEAPRYHARDVAVMRGHMEKAVVILGSATPSFESYNNALKGKYILAKLTKRVDNCLMPEIKVIDLRRDASESGKIGFFSQSLIEAVRNRLMAGEQTILFLNRRGFARQMICMHCGFVAQCPDCSVPYTYHKKMENLSCHLCRSVIEAPKTCPQCNDKEIRYTGVGTEKIETYAADFFKGAKIVRMDSDSMRGHDSYQKVFDDFNKGNIDILIGTQMIAKGHHFPNVTLVGVINADLSLYLPDFRAPERTFQLLTQVAGRAGRGEVKGEVIIQTVGPHNPAIVYAANNDFDGFFNEEMEIRRELSFPPEGHMIALHFRGEDSAKVSAYANEFLEKVTPFVNKDIIISGPAPAPIERIKKHFRFIMMFRGRNMKIFRNQLRELVLHSKRSKDVEMYIDVDALSLL